MTQIGPNAGVPELVVVESPDWIPLARDILVEYGGTLGGDLDRAAFERELAELPGTYGVPDGTLLLATVDGQVAGCGAFRSLVDVDYPNACEMKRLYVRPGFRRFGLGRMLAQALVESARERGYSNMLLDTLDDMEAARELYATLGFVEIPPYYYNPNPGAHYLRADLTQVVVRY